MAVWLLGALLPLVLALNGGAFGQETRQTAFLLIWWLVAVGLIAGILPRAKPTRELRHAILALGGLAAWTATALLWTESVEQTGAEVARVTGYLGIVVLVATFVSRRTWRSAALGVATALVALPVLSVLSRLAPEALPNADVAGAFGLERLSYPLDYWNAVAAWSALAVTVGLCVSVHARRRHIRQLFLASVPVAVLAIHVTYSRSGAILVVFGTLAVVAFSADRRIALIHTAAAALASGVAIAALRAFPELVDGTGGSGGIVVGLVLVVGGAGCAWVAGARRRPRPHGRIRAPRGALARLAAVAGIVAAVGAIAIASVDREGASTATGALKADNIVAADPVARLTNLETDRTQYWASAWEAFESEPLSGIGPGSFTYWWDRDVDQESGVLDAHSLYLEFAAELGVLGLVGVLLLFGLLLRAAWSTRAVWTEGTERGLGLGLSLAFILLALFCALDWYWELTALFVVGLLGVLVVGAAGSRARRGWRSVTLGRAAGVAGAIALGGLQIPGIVSADRIEASLGEVGRGFPDRARELADDAVSAQPWAASGYAIRGYDALVAGDLDAARADSLEAIDHEPANWRHHWLLAQVEIAEGRLGAARAALDDVAAARVALTDEVRQLKASLDEVSADAVQGGAIASDPTDAP